MPIIGLGERVPAYEQLPLQWMPHIQVADVAASVERALALGGEKLMYAADDEGVGLWAVLLDPNGAAFGIIPVVAPEHSSLGDGSPSPDAVRRAGRIARIDLTVADATATRDFYRQVVGWSSQDVEQQDEAGSYSDYALLAADGTPTAGIRHARGASQGLPPVWLLHLPVGDLAESLRRAERAGGEVLQATRGADGELAQEHRDVLLGATSLELVAVDPDWPTEESRADPSSLHGYGVRGRATITDRDLRLELLTALADGARENDGMVAACFNPRHAIRAELAGKTCELIICFECLAFEVWDGTERVEVVDLSATPSATFDRIYTAAGLSIAPGS